jgi:hypothetical protein
MNFVAENSCAAWSEKVSTSALLVDQGVAVVPNMLQIALDLSPLSWACRSQRIASELRTLASATISPVCASPWPITFHLCDFFSWVQAHAVQKIVIAPRQLVMYVVGSWLYPGHSLGTVASPIWCSASYHAYSAQESNIASFEVDLAFGTHLSQLQGFRFNRCLSFFVRSSVQQVAMRVWQTTRVHF